MPTFNTELTYAGGYITLKDFNDTRYSLLSISICGALIALHNAPFI